MSLLDKLDALIAETEKATPGPWEAVEDAVCVKIDQLRDETALLDAFHPNYEKGDLDAEFIAYARTGYPAALRALKVAVEILLDVDVCAKCFPSGEYDCPEIVCYGCKAIAEIEKEFKCTNTN